MADTPASLRWQATTLERRAGEVTDLANLLERHHEDLGDRLRRVLDKHTAEVWDSDAAMRSRRALHIGGTRFLAEARGSLISVVSDLRRHATELEDEAQTLRRRANALEAQLQAELEAAAAAAAVAASVAPTESIDPPLAGVGVIYW